jgi:hypothetical protein
LNFLLLTYKFFKVVKQKSIRPQANASNFFEPVSAIYFTVTAAVSLA